MNLRPAAQFSVKFLIMSNFKFELIIGLVFAATVFFVYAGMIGLAKALRLKFLFPYIASSFFWILAVLNFHDARVKVDSATGRVASNAERISAFIRAIGFCLVTVPFFLRKSPLPFYGWTIFGMLLVLSTAIIQGLLRNRNMRKKI
jgi:hypothetical protein